MINFLSIICLLDFPCMTFQNFEGEAVLMDLGLVLINRKFWRDSVH